MKYLLDFDGVIFNTKALKAKMAELAIPEEARGLDVFQTIDELDPTFDFTSLVFPGAQKFLAERGSDCHIISSAYSEDPENNTDEKKQREFQLEKIRRAGLSELLPNESIDVVGKEKGDTLAELKEKYGESLVFLDDRERYVREARRLDINAVWMDREQRGYMENPEGVPTMLEFPRVGSFEEFRDHIASLETSE